jgi:hypothetical protein
MFFLTEDLDEHREDFDIHVRFFTHREPPPTALNLYTIDIIDIPVGDLKNLKRESLRKRIIAESLIKQSDRLDRG